MAAAAEMLGITERTFRRWSTRYAAEGAARRLGQASARAVPVDEVVQMVTLYESRSTGWTVQHFHERWQHAHGGTRAYTWTKKKLQAAGQVVRTTRRGTHRKRRPRTPVPGMMRHQDGSPHEWGPGCQWELMVTLDAATRTMDSAFFVEEEGTMSSVQGLRDVIETQGLFSSLSPDRGTHEEEAGGKMNKSRLTQRPRAVQQRGITRIPAYSPEARGRSERVVRTVHDRVPQELALAGITDMAAANRSLAERFLPAYTRRVAVPAPESGTAFVPWLGTNRAALLCVHEKRGVANANTVRSQGRSL
ncbi:MAG TPA: transposase [Nitrospira sp.]|nr:transposase [Nitrospira sp.]